MPLRPETRGTSAGWIIGLAIVSVLLLILPGGVYAGVVLATLVLATVLLNPSLRQTSRMLAISAIAVLATAGGLIASILSA